MQTIVFSKTGAETLSGAIPLQLATGESVLSITPGTVTPADSGGLTFTVTNGATITPPITFTVVGGQEGVTYGVPLTIRTSVQVLVITAAIVCASASFAPYLNADPTSYQQLVGGLAPGKSALATSVFNFDPSFDPSGGYVMWDLLGTDGTIYATGNAYDYTITSTGFSNTVTAHAVISLPMDIPPALDAPYQLRYTLRVGNGVAYNYENLQVYGGVDIQVGTSDAIEMQGDVATLTLVTESLYQNYSMELYGDTGLIGAMDAVNPERVANGYIVAGSFDTTQLPVSLTSYRVVWKFWNNTAQIFRESAALWVVNPSVLQAVDDVKSKVNKARQTLYGTPDSQFPATEIMKWLRRGMDAFNGAYGVFTSFDMTNAMGAVREFWLLEAEKMALEAQYLAEGEKAFQFSGAAISLDVDRTQYLDSAAQKIQSQLDAELKSLKQNLLIKGWASGDGSAGGTANFNSAQRGAMGAVGINISPAQVYGAGWYPTINL